MKESMFIGLVIGSAMSSALFGFLINNSSSWYHTDELVEEGVGDYTSAKIIKRSFVL